MIAMLLALPCAGCSSWTTEKSTRIDAPPSEVWAVLADLPRYPEWNTYSPKAEGELREGGVVTITADLDGEIRVVDNRVTRVEPGQVLCWHSMNWYESLARGTRCRFLEERDGGTLFRHHEIMEGPLAFAIEWIYRPRIDAGLETMNRDLKTHVEEKIRLRAD